MTYFEEEFDREEEEERPPDPRQEEARDVLRAFFDKRRERVCFGRQVEVQHEGRFFHWVTDRALRDLRGEGFIVGEERELSWGGHLSLRWHRGYRYPRRAAQAVVDLVEEYSAPAIGEALGLHGEQMVLEGFAREQFVMRGRKVKSYGGRDWVETGHDLDFVFEKNGCAYGIEVKNTLGYMSYGELGAKVRLSRFLGLTPVFVVRMVPKSPATSPGAEPCPA